jgi:tetratricopeptide (TPR) repeat protein
MSRWQDRSLSNLDRILFALKEVKGKDKRATLFIGAGCSISGGIPSAEKIVEEHKERFHLQYEAATRRKTDDETRTGEKYSIYPYFMRELEGTYRDEIISGYLEKSRINWAHVAIAQLIKHGYVGRVLTVNFDRLIVRSCAMLDCFPAIYDFTSISKAFNADTIPEESVFYLHGQGGALPLIHRIEDSQEMVADLGPVLEESFRNRPVIVAGYSGESDPIFQLIQAQSRFGRGLFWTNYSDTDPKEHIKPLLEKSDGAYYLPGQDADSFFVQLCQQLGCFPPKLFGDPFAHMIELLENVTPFHFPNRPQEDVLERTRDKLRKAQILVEQEEQQETGNDPQVVQGLFEALLAGDYVKAVAAVEKLNKPDAADANENASWAYVMLGSEFVIQAELKSGTEADDLFAQAFEKYTRAIEIKSDKHEAFNNWGIALSDQAMLKSGVESDDLFAQAYEKYARAVEIQPDKYMAFNNWGRTLSEQAKLKSGVEADDLFAQAYEKYARAVEIKPDMHMAFNNWGGALSEQAMLKSGVEADDLFAQAYEKYARAVEIKPDIHMVFNNWGGALIEQANLKPDTEANQLLDLAEEKLKTALNLSSTGTSYNLACLYALRGQENDCREWLEKTYDVGTLPNCDLLAKDTTLDSVREKPWFKEFLVKVGCV